MAPSAAAVYSTLVPPGIGGIHAETVEPLRTAVGNNPHRRGKFLMKTSPHEGLREIRREIDGTRPALADVKETVMFTRILVPTDFSRSSDAALAHARGFASRTGASLHLLHVADNTFLRTVHADPRNYEAAALWQLQEQFPDGDAGAILVVERSEAPADEIARYARIHNIDLIVMGTHGRNCMANLLLGSVAEKVVRTAPCPVLTVNDHPVAGEPKGLRILVATDFSPSSDAALGYAKRLAARVRGTIRLLHVVEESASAVSLGSEPGIAGPAREEQMVTPRRLLSRRILDDTRSRVKIDSDVVFGPSDLMITTYARLNGFDLIVMGTHGRTGLSHLLMGSVAESVIQIAPCPVLTVKTQGARHAEEPADAVAIGAAV
jgi:nucleotide-binding universal stress UspA family protein